jgi:hypothetical protein
MDPRAVIANRIDLGLRRHLGEGVDPQRTLDDSLYARDVLLVCDTMKHTDLPQLAQQFRSAVAHMEAERRARQQRRATRERNKSGFGASRPAALEAQASLFSPSRWLSSLAELTTV